MADQSLCGHGPSLRLAAIVFYTVGSLLLQATVSAAPSTSASRVSNQITLADGASEVRLSVPLEYREYPDPGQDYVIVRAKYPDMHPVRGNYRVERTDIRIIVKLRKKETQVSRFLKDHARLLGSTLPNASTLVGREDPFDVYSVGRPLASGGIRTWRVTTLPDGTLLGIEDPGDFSVNLHGSRLVRGQIEVRYAYKKTLFASPLEVDAAVVKLVESFLLDTSTGK